MGGMSNPPCDSREGMEILFKWARAHRMVLSEAHERMAKKWAVDTAGVTISRPLRMTDEKIFAARHAHSEEMRRFDQEVAYPLIDAWVFDQLTSPDSRDADRATKDRWRDSPLQWSPDQLKAMRDKP